jgi:hypothetical protein
MFARRSSQLIFILFKYKGGEVKFLMSLKQYSVKSGVSKWGFKIGRKMLFS